MRGARVTHPTLISGEGRESVSGVYDWRAVVDRYNQALAPAPDAAAFSYGGEDLPAVRQFALAQAMRLGMAGERLMDVELAVAELTTNSAVHGGGCGTLAIWAEQGQLVCEVRDAGRLADPLAGRRPPDRGQPGGRGLSVQVTAQRAGKPELRVGGDDQPRPSVGRLGVP